MQRDLQRDSSPYTQKDHLTTQTQPNQPPTSNRNFNSKANATFGSKNGTAINTTKEKNPLAELFGEENFAQKIIEIQK